MNHLMVISKVLIGLAGVVLFATALPAVAGATPESVNESAVFNAGKTPANPEAEARADDTCAAADKKESCNTATGFPPMDVAASFLSAMAGCSRGGM